MFIEIGDKNCVINPTTQRCRIGIERKEPNTKLLEFMAAFNLTEPIMAQHPEEKIYTRASPNGRSKAKLDHVLVNNAALNAISETGWIEENPFIPSDHGIVWIALDRSKLIGIIRSKGKKQQRETRNDNIRLKGARERMHEKYTGVLVRTHYPH